MEKIIQTDLDFIKENVKLSDKEAKNADRFIKKHRECKTENRSFNNIKYKIIFSETSLGSFVMIQCEKCHKEKDSSDDVRSNW